MPSGWEATCAAERVRAHTYLAHHGASAPLDIPLTNNVSTFSLDRRRPAAYMQHFRETLLHVLHSRGTLCSAEMPCSVTWPTGARRSSAGEDGVFDICLPPSRGATICEVKPVGESFELRKACNDGGGPRCFRYNGRAISRVVGVMRGRAQFTRRRNASRGVIDGCGSCKPIPEPLQRTLHRCAVVGSGHSLRCKLGRWARLIDDLEGGHYAAVWRANAYPQRGGKLRGIDAGTRTDYAYNNCEEAPPGAFCLNSANVTAMGLRPGIRMGFWKKCRSSGFCTDFLSSGLGWAHSGGHLVDLAVAMCQRVDVYGMGLLARGGVGGDLLYQHHYDQRVAPNCNIPCATWGLAWRSNASKMVCRPQTPCLAKVDLHGPPGRGAWKIGVPLLSEEQDDFFYRSELRLAVMHVLGLINWVWY